MQPINTPRAYTLTRTRSSADEPRGREGLKGDPRLTPEHEIGEPVKVRESGRSTAGPAKW